MKNAILLLSGGADSVALLSEYSKDIQSCIFFDYGQEACSTELMAAIRNAERLGKPLETIPLQLPKEQDSPVYPMRNGIFLLVAAAKAIEKGCGEILIGCCGEDSAMFPDCRTEAIEAINGYIKQCGYEVEVKTPFILKRKVEIAKIIERDSLTYHSCYHSKACGECVSCKQWEGIEPKNKERRIGREV